MSTTLKKVMVFISMTILIFIALCCVVVILAGGVYAFVVFSRFVAALLGKFVNQGIANGLGNIVSIVALFAIGLSIISTQKMFGRGGRFHKGELRKKVDRSGYR